MNTFTLVLVFGAVMLNDHGQVVNHNAIPETYRMEFSTMQQCRQEESRQLTLKRKLHQPIYNHQCIVGHASK